MYSHAIGCDLYFLLVIRMSLVCHSYVLVCRPFVTRMWLKLKEGYHLWIYEIIFHGNLSSVSNLQITDGHWEKPIWRQTIGRTVFPFFHQLSVILKPQGLKIWSVQIRSVRLIMTQREITLTVKHIKLREHLTSICFFFLILSREP